MEKCDWKTCPVNVLLSDKSNQKKNDICRRCIDMGKEKIREDRKKTAGDW